MEPVKIEKHPSYVQVSIVRTSGGSGNFYGTEIHPQHFITMKITESEKHTDSLMGEQYVAGKSIIEIDMTALQFSEMITTMNMLGGVPATLIRMNNQAIEECPKQDSKVDIAVNGGIQGIDETEKDINDWLKEIEQIAEKSAGKKAYEAIKKNCQTIKGRMKGSTDFYKSKIVKAGAETISKIKVETENHISSKILEETEIKALSFEKREDKTS